MAQFLKMMGAMWEAKVGAAGRASAAAAAAAASGGRDSWRHEISHPAAAATKASASVRSRSVSADFMILGDRPTGGRDEAAVPRMTPAWFENL